MKIKGPLLSILFLTLLYIVGCKNQQDDPAPPSPSKTELLTAKTWKMTALNVNPGYDTTIGIIPYTLHEVYFILPECKKDDTYKFNKDSSFVESEETEVCTPSAAGTGIWYFNKLQSTVTTILNSDTTIYTIKELSDSKFVATSSKPLTFHGKSYTTTPTFTPKQ